MNEKNMDSKSRVRGIVFKALKATVKGVLFYLVYFFVWMMISPTATMVPGLQQMVETFVAVYITLMIIGEFTSGTILHFVFDAAKALFVIGYLILSLNGGTWGMTFENVNLMVDLRWFLAIMMVLSLLGLAKSVLGAINFMSEKAEPMLLQTN